MSKTQDLLTYWEKWMENPDDPYISAKWVEKIDRIITAVSRRRGIMLDYRVEGAEDFRQEARMHLLQASSKVTDPSNKRIMNYLRVTLEGILHTRTKKVCRKLDRYKADAEMGKAVKFHEDEYSVDFPDFQDPVLNQIAVALAQGNTKESVREELGLTPPRFSKMLAKIKTGLEARNDLQLH